MFSFNRQRIKDNARRFYDINKSNAILVIFLLVIIAVAISLLELAPLVGVVASLVGNIFIMPVLTLGAMGWFHTAIHKERCDFSLMFDPFRENYWSNLGCMLLRNIYIFLWSLLLIVPGIIKTYAYLMTEYIKYENPHIPAERAIKLSCIMTEGHKMELFLLHLSFIGWFLLSGLTIHILGVVYVFPYYYAAQAFAYEELKAMAINSGKISPDELRTYGVSADTPPSQMSVLPRIAPAHTPKAEPQSIGFEPVSLAKPEEPDMPEATDINPPEFRPSGSATDMDGLDTSAIGFESLDK
ncbi:MAG: DUF975 family protein [Oscillospiraceae bacterium]|nr:DUF975 family protein [Oscillospiraceae bacterium]